MDSLAAVISYQHSPGLHRLWCLGRRGQRKRKVTFSIVTCGNSSHVVAPYFQVSASGYFVLRFPEMCSVCACLCVCFSCLTTESSQSSKHCLVWCSQQLKHIPRLHTFLPFGFVCLHDFPPYRQCHKGRPGDHVHASICQEDRLVQRDVCLRWGGPRTGTTRDKV